MKIKLSELRKIIKEVASASTGMIEQPLEQLRQTISAMSPGDVATTEYVDSDSGEIYLSKGDLARDSALHPQYAEDRAELSRYRKKWSDELASDTAEDIDYDETEDEDEQLGTASLYEEFQETVREFASNWSEYAEESPEDLAPEHAAHDAALGFFSDYPDWRKWADAVGMTKSEMHAAVQDSVYAAMLGEL